VKKIQVKPTVAVIEDDEFQRNLLVLSLNNVGYPCWGVDSAENFFRQAAISHFDVAIVDVGLPGEDGLSVMKHISHITDIGVICITGDTSVATEVNAWQSGVQMFFHKPLVLEKVIMAIGLIWGRLQSSVPVVPDEPSNWVLSDVESTIYSPDGIAVSLSQSELAFLKILAERPMELVPNTEILSLMFGADPEAEHRLAMLLSRLRRKLRSKNLAPPLRSIFGRGRVFAAGVVCVNSAPAKTLAKTGAELKVDERTNRFYRRS
jgi:DNA-binding response OmpR family regulator